MVPRLRVPFSATARARKRARLIIVFVTGLVANGVVLFGATTYALRPASFAVPAASYVTIAGAVGWAFLVFSIVGDYRNMRARHLGTAILFASATGALTLGSAREVWHQSVSVAAAEAGLATLASGAFMYFWTRRAAWRALLTGLRTPATHSEAQETYRAADRALGSRHVSVEEEKNARLNRARAAIERSRGDDAPDGLVEAVDELIYLHKNP